MKQLRRAYVLLSGGVDSTTCLHIADKEFKGEIVGVSVDYGQRHQKEMEHAQQTCKALGFRHRVVNMKGVIPSTMLTNREIEVPNISYDEITGVSPTYVPFRNGLLLSALASVVQGDFQQFWKDTEGEWAIYFGAHAEDAANWAYPDCTPEFIGAMANAIHVGTYNKVRLHTPLQWLTKAEIIKRGEALNVDWSLTWSCYRGENLHCGVCPTCRARRKGFIEANVTDPTRYAA
jgi:7-cyano-7-deazaguanine synthase